MPVAANACAIYSVSHKNSFLWKWRYTGVDGGENVSAEGYTLFSDCAAAARASGYEPQSDWTGPCAVIPPQHRRPRKEPSNETLTQRDSSFADAGVPVV